MEMSWRALPSLKSVARSGPLAAKCDLDSWRVLADRFLVDLGCGYRKTISTMKSAVA
jgi:hypothetical protein